MNITRREAHLYFVTMLDASKAFDRVNFWLLFDKLIARSVPLFIVRILAVWYTPKIMCIRWGNVYSSSFSVSNGVKQGRILSQILFNVYMDDLSVSLNSSNMCSILTKGSTCRKNKKIRFFLILIEQVMTNLLKKN